MEAAQKNYQDSHFRMSCLQLAQATGETDAQALVAMAQKFYDFVKASAPSPA